MLILNSLSALSQTETLRKIAHDIRIVNAVYHIETDSFGPDMREERTIVGQKILSNLFQTGTAVVGGRSVVARNPSRAAASVALRDVRAGRVPSHSYTVSMRNRRGLCYIETVYFGFDHEPIQDKTDADGLNRANIDRFDMGHVSTKRIDDHVFQNEPTRPAPFSPMTDEERSANNWERAMERKAARDAAK